MSEAEDRTAELRGKLENGELEESAKNLDMDEARGLRRELKRKRVVEEISDEAVGRLLDSPEFKEALTRKLEEVVDERFEDHNGPPA